MLASRLVRAAALKKTYVAAAAGATAAYTTAAAPLTEVLGGLPHVSPAESGITKSGEVKMSTLENGVQVASIEQGGSVSAVGAFVRAGSRFESPDQSGAALMLERAAFGATATTSKLVTVRKLENMGGAAVVSSGPEQTVFSIDVPRDHVSFGVDLLGDVVVNAQLKPHEAADLAYAVKTDMADDPNKGQVYVDEALRQAAFSGTGVGKPHMPAYFEHLTSDTINAFHAQHYTADNIVLVGVNVGHDELVKVAEASAFAAAGAPGAPTDDVSTYAGGQALNDVKDGTSVQVALGFEAPALTSPADFVAAAVAQQIVGGGGAFSSGGPGKGMHSRAFQNVLNRYPWAEMVNFFYIPFSDAGLLGITGVTSPSHAYDLTSVLAQEMKKLAAGDLAADELERAKVQVQSNALMQLETRGGLLEDIGMQLLHTGKRFTDAEVIELVQGVTAADVQGTVAAACAKPVTVAASGALGGLPSYDVIANAFKSA